MEERSGRGDREVKKDNDTFRPFSGSSLLAGDKKKRTKTTDVHMKSTSAIPGPLYKFVFSIFLLAAVKTFFSLILAGAKPEQRTAHGSHRGLRSETPTVDVPWHDHLHMIARMALSSILIPANMSMT